jgi:hypothetical protein
MMAMLLQMESWLLQQKETSQNSHHQVRFDTQNSLLAYIEGLTAAETVDTVAPAAVVYSCLQDQCYSFYVDRYFQLVRQ